MTERLIWLGRTCLAAAAWLGLTVSSATAAGACQMRMVAQLQTTSVHRPLVEGEVEGHPVHMLIDSGACCTALLAGAARALKLSVHDMLDVSEAYGVGGKSKMRRAMLHDLKVGAFEAKNIPVAVVGDPRVFDPDDATLLIGSDFLNRFDVEFDLPDRVVRLFKSKDCPGDEVMYWSKTYSVADTEPIIDPFETTKLHIRLNDKVTLAELDSGAELTVATPLAAKIASATVIAGSDGKFHGIGSSVVTSQRVSLNSIQIGDEVIRRTNLFMGDMFVHNVEAQGGPIRQPIDSLTALLLGDDFLAAHRLIIVRDQRKIYFTYTGGPVFAAGPKTAAPAATPSPTPPQPNAPSPG